VGCSMPELDNHDTRMVEETLHGTYSAKGSRTGKLGLIDKESDSEGFSGLNIYSASRPATWDSDQDGIPDWFEKATGTDPNTANNNDDSDGNGYTDLEDYLNWMALPHFEVAEDADSVVDLNKFFAGYSAPEYTLVSHPNGVNATLDGALLYVRATAEAPSLFQLVVSAQQDGVSLERTFNFYRGLFDDPTAIRDLTTAPAMPDAYLVYSLSGTLLQRQSTAPTAPVAGHRVCIVKAQKDGRTLSAYKLTTNN